MEDKTQSAAAVVIDGVVHDMRDDICMKALPVAIKAIYGRERLKSTKRYNGGRFQKLGNMGRPV